MSIEGCVSDSAGPLEATVANMTRELAAEREATRQAQEEWIKMQKELLRITARNEKIEEQIRKQSSILAVKEQQQKRLDNQCDSIAQHVV
jgi:ABC-type transport system involved in cytochrome bd biosynthesis fused ATPase/permease subunit